VEKDFLVRADVQLLQLFFDDKPKLDSDVRYAPSTRDCSQSAPPEAETVAERRLAGSTHASC
jgi:hypothetical protein